MSEELQVKVQLGVVLIDDSKTASGERPTLFATVWDEKVKDVEETDDAREVL